MVEVKYPEVEVQLTGNDGNAFGIMARVTKALQKAGVSKAERDAYMNEAMGGDYNNLLVVTMNWVTVL